MKYRIINPLIELINEEISFINEIDADDAYNKFYRNLDYKTYGQLVMTDPTYDPVRNNFGKYSKWLLKQHSKLAL